MIFDFEDELRDAVARIRPLLPDRSPRAVLIAGSGLGRLIDRGTLAEPVDISAIDGLPIPSVPGHGRMLGVLEFDGNSFLYFGGRAHYYEGHPPQRLGMAVRIADALGIRTLVSTCTVGSVNESIPAGSLVLIRDHINLAGVNPLVGVQPPCESGRFPGTDVLYDPELLGAAAETTALLNIPAATGVYAWVSGPSYETPAEARMLAAMGADVIGMSLVPETLTAAQLGMRVLAMACVTNSLVADDHAGLDHEGVLNRAEEMADSLGRLISALAPRLCED
jgi:purine-nucleoside phosphorylase